MSGSKKNETSINLNKRVMIINYPHKRAIHCETGSIRNLLKFYGYEISEPMILGIGSGLTFIHFPFPMFANHEAPIFRIMPTKVFANFTKNLNLNSKVKTFRDKEKSMKKLDELLDKGIPTGLVTEISKISYFKAAMPVGHRFSGHHIVVVGKENDNYFLSETDWNFYDDSLFQIKADELKNARFTNELMSPKGKMFYFPERPLIPDLKPAIIKGIKKTCFNMLDNPFPFFGAKGIKFFGKRILLYEKKYGAIQAVENMKFQLILSEMAGTGGSGYRYFYADFLKEAADIFNDDTLRSLSNDMKAIADEWRQFAIDNNRYTNLVNSKPFPKSNFWETIRQSPVSDKKDLQYMSEMISNISDMELDFFKNLRKWVNNK